VDGVMVGREAYHNPWSMAGWDAWSDHRLKALPARDVAQRARAARLQAAEAAMGTQDD
jgi:tRNA-dihydrouridine synthase A